MSARTERIASCRSVLKKSIGTLTPNESGTLSGMIRTRAAKATEEVKFRGRTKKLSMSNVRAAFSNS